MIHVHNRIVNLSSMAGLLSSANMGAYFASKHAVEGMAKCLREEMKVRLPSLFLSSRYRITDPFE